MTERHRFRAEWHDYNDGTYFVTICSHEKSCIFGSITGEIMTLSILGTIIENCIGQIPFHHPDTQVLNHVVMPNHVHLVLSIMKPVGALYIAPASAGCLKAPKHREPCIDNHYNSRLSVVVRTFKASCSRLYSNMLREQNIATSPHIWQRGFHEHIIRNKHSFDRIMAYIDNNISSWNDDCINLTVRVQDGICP